MGWFGNSLTGRIAGVKGMFKNLSPEDLEKYILWFISDFGFRKCPVYRVEILHTENSKIYLSPLRVFVKNSSGYTYLTPCNKPTQTYPEGAPDIENFLPSTDEISFRWRRKKVRVNKERKPTQELEECSHLVENRKISLLSCRDRQEILDQLQEAKEIQKWKDWKETSIQNKASRQDIVDIKSYLKQKEILRERQQKQEEIFGTEIRGEVRRLGDIPVGKYSLLGWLSTPRLTKILLKRKEKYYVSKTNTQLDNKILPVLQKHFREKEDSKKNIRKYYFVPNIEEDYFILLTHPKEKIMVYSKRIEYIPIQIFTPKYKQITKELEEALQKEEYIEEKRANLVLQELELPKDPKEKKKMLRSRSWRIFDIRFYKDNF